MTEMIIDGKKISNVLKDNLKEEIAQLKNQYGRWPKLAVVLVGDDPASQVYVRNKEKACLKIGIENLLIKKDKTIREEELLGLIDALNEDQSVDGILVQLPLPGHIDEMKVIERISPTKDVDGFHPDNIASLFLDRVGFHPCTPEGVMALLDAIGCSLSGKEVVVVGRSHNVGKPIALLALARNATVTIAHSKTKNLAEICRRADVLIVAVGKANMIDASYVKKGAVVIDVGINRLENGKLCGDVNYEEAAPLTSAITPVPGGVGPMTVAMLMKNTVEAYKRGMKK